jgi:pimeloyl-ACP methyl ester carboxylesterase/DNA-binding CsgD family transcriptional regulator
MTLRDGPPLLCDLGRLHHLGFFWRYPPYRRLVELLAREFMVIQIDRPGCGLSDRSHADFTLPAELALFGRLLDHLGLEETSVLASGTSSPVMIAAAAMCSERVTRLVLFGARASGSPEALPYLPALRTLMQVHAEVAVDWLTRLAASGEPTFAEWLGRAYREAGSGEVIAQWIDESVRLDVRHLLTRVRCPTLVLHRRGDRVVPFAHGRDVAAGIPDATLLPVDGSSNYIWEGETDAVVDAVVSFVSPGFERGQPSAPYHLTERQREVAQMVALGLSNREIAERLGISRRTVESHLQRLRLTLELSSRAQLAAWSIAAGVCEEPPTAR